MKNGIFRLGVAFVVLATVCGCVSKDVFLDGICRTSASHDTFDELFWESIRRFPANHDERQCAVYGTNEWVRVESYPDGTPYRVVRGGVMPNGRPDDITTSSVEYDFSGNVISSYSLYNRPEVKVDLADFAKSVYWMDSRRVIHVRSCLAQDYAYDLYYYQASEISLKVGVWALDRKSRTMDKLVMDVRLVNGRAVNAITTDLHVGDILNLENFSVDAAGRIALRFKLSGSGKSVDLIGVIGNVSGPFGGWRGTGSSSNSVCM